MTALGVKRKNTESRDTKKKKKWATKDLASTRQITMTCARVKSVQLSIQPLPVEQWGFVIGSEAKSKHCNDNYQWNESEPLAILYFFVVTYSRLIKDPLFERCC